LAGPDGTGASVLTSTRVAFNGCGAAAGGPLDIRQNQLPPGVTYSLFDTAWLSFCQPDGQPYDAAVAATFLGLRWHFPDVRITHASCEGAWPAASQLFTRVTGWPIPTPGLDMEGDQL